MRVAHLFILLLGLTLSFTDSAIAAGVHGSVSICRKIVAGVRKPSFNFRADKGFLFSQAERPLDMKSRKALIESLRTWLKSPDRYIAEVAPHLSLEAIIQRFSAQGLSLGFLQQVLSSITDLSVPDILAIVNSRDSAISIAGIRFTENELIVWLHATGHSERYIASRVKSMTPANVRDRLAVFKAESSNGSVYYTHPIYGAIVEKGDLVWPNAMNFLYDQWEVTDSEIADILGISESVLTDFYATHSIRRDETSSGVMLPYVIGIGSEMIQSRREQKRRIILDDCLGEVERAQRNNEPLYIKHMPYSLDVIHDYFETGEDFFLALKERGILRGVDVSLLSAQLPKFESELQKELQGESVLGVLWFLLRGKSLSDISLLPSVELGFGWREFVGFTASDGAGRIIFSKQFKALEAVFERALLYSVSPSQINYLPNGDFSKKYRELWQGAITEVYLYTFLTTGKFPVQSNIESKIGLSWEAMTGSTQSEGHRVFVSFDDLLKSVESAILVDPRFTSSQLEAAQKQIETARSKSLAGAKAKRFREKGGLDETERAELKAKVRTTAANVFLAENRMVNRPELEKEVDMSWTYIIGTPPKGKTENTFRVFDSIAQMYAEIREEIISRNPESAQIAYLDTLIADRMARSAAMTGRSRAPHTSAQ